LLGRSRNAAEAGTCRIHEHHVGAVKLTDVIESTLLLIGDRLRGVAFSYSGDAIDACVLADRVRLEQVLINLLQNAIDALDGMPSPQITMKVHRNGKRIAIEVADNGHGLPEDLEGQLLRHL